jgi:UDP-3-O-[3-hydroxymyristoyl] glucosamine N-acyltransferase
MVMTFTLQELATRFGLEVAGDGATKVDGLCTLTPGTPGRLSFLSNPRLRAQLADSQAAAVIVRKADAKHVRNGLIASDPYLAYAKIATLFDPYRDFPEYRHPSAVIGPGVKIGKGCCISMNAVIADNSEIGDHCFIGPNCVVLQNVRIGSDTTLAANVFVWHGVRIGARCNIQPGAVIGSRGFGNAPTKQGWVEVPQLGSVVVGDDVEIGANTTIDRGALDDTVIEDGVKLDNQIQIAHNVRVGAHTAMAACVGIAGSTRIGARCMIGGAAGIGGHLQIADDVVILGGSMVAQSLRKKGVYGSALPAHDARVWRRTVVRLHRIKEYEDRLKALERHLGITPAHKEESSEDDV